GAGRHQERNGAEEDDEVERGMAMVQRQPRDQDAAVRQTKAPGRAAGADEPAAAVARRRQPQRDADRRDQLAVLAIERKIGGDPGRGGRGGPCGCGGSGASAGGRRAAASSPATSKAWPAGEVSQPARQIRPATATTSNRLMMMVR